MNIEATIIVINYNGAGMNIGSIYSPPRNKNIIKLLKTQYKEIFQKLATRFIIGGDYNVTHTAWGSRLTHGEGNNFLGAINEPCYKFHSSYSPTCCPTNNNKIPDLLEFFISKGIQQFYRSEKYGRPNIRPHQSFYA